MIVVLGCPVADPRGVPGAFSRVTAAGLAVDIAAAVAATGSRVELVGAVGDDAAGDAVVVDLGRREIGHAALRRDPARPTPAAGHDPGAAAWLEPADVELGLRYLADVSVLVAVEPLAPEVRGAAWEAAGFHGAQVVSIADPAAGAPEWPGDGVTVLERPADGGGAFAEMAGRFAADLDSGTSPRQALAAAATAAGWESVR